VSFTFTLSDVQFLRAASENIAEFDSVLELTAESQLRDLGAARRRFGSHAAAVVETAVLRRRAVVKLGDRAGRWLFTDEALQQATPWPVAVHRARRLAGVGVHDVTCSIGADLAALTAGSVVLGSDLDPVRVAMAQHNVGDRVLVADALRPVSSGLLPYADPARRDGGGRRILSASTLPSLADLDAAWSHRLPVLRVPPGIDYDVLARPGEVEVVSLDGSAREAVLWPPELADVRRRATVLTGDQVRYQLADTDPDEVPIGSAGRYLVDPDSAVVRAHLVRHFGYRHALWQLDPQLAYLTGDTAPPVGRAFEILEAAPFSEKTVAGWLRAAQVGTLEIKVRGLPVVPDDLRLRLRKAMTGPRSNDRTLVLARVGRGSMAYLTKARTAPQ
jgi:hypothetical protein